jgi:uncharacterized membrane protein
MCLIISCIFLALAYSFFQEANMQGVFINASIALLFIVLFVRNILKVKKEKSKQ